MASVHLKYASAGFFGHFLEVPHSTAAEVESATPVGARIHVVDAVNHAIRLLSLLNCLRDGIRAALVFAVRNQNDDLAAHLFR